MPDLAMDIPMLLDTTTLARGLLMLSPRQRLMLIQLFFMDPIMADMVWVMPDMLDLAMDIPMLLDTMDTTLARGLLMPSPRPRLMLILLFSMVPMDMADMALVIADMAMLPLTLMAMLATHMPGENKLLTR